MDAIVELQDVKKEYGSGSGRTVALDIPELSVRRGEFLAIEGPSGCGKTTMVQIMGLLDRPTSGRVVFDGQDAARLRPVERAKKRNRDIGFVFQQFNLLPNLNVRQNVELPMVAAGVRRAERTRRAQEFLAQVGLAAKSDRMPSALSGGEQQRVAIARALVNRPKLILADEPTGNLDRTNADQIMELFGRLQEQTGATLVVVTHDPKIGAAAKRILRRVMSK